MSTRRSKKQSKGWVLEISFNSSAGQIFLDNNVYRPCPGKPIALFNDIPFLSLERCSILLLLFVFCLWNSQQQTRRSTKTWSKLGKCWGWAKRWPTWLRRVLSQNLENFDLVTWPSLLNFRQGKVIEQDSVSIRIKPFISDLKIATLFKYCIKSSLQSPWNYNLLEHVAWPAFILALELLFRQRLYCVLSRRKNIKLILLLIIC